MGDLAIFEYVLVVSLDVKHTEKDEPKITYRYPPEGGQKDTVTIGSIGRFCFPETDKDLAKLSKISKRGPARSQTFNFVLTEVDGARRFGYCRRLHTVDAKRGVPVLECFCIISKCPSFSIFRQILDVVEERRKVGSSAVFIFLKAVSQKPFPHPGDVLEVKTFGTGSSGGPDVYSLGRSSQTGFEYLDYVSFSTLFGRLPLEMIVELYGMVVLERRCIFCSNNLGTLSACINAISSLIYPFAWQHVFIPVLPKSLLDYCCAPMPFMVGILSSSLPALSKLPLEEVVIVELDKGTYITKPSFESCLPPSSIAALSQKLNYIIKSLGKKGRALDLEIARTFLSFQQGLFESYPGYMRGNVKTFDREGFVASTPKVLQPFIREAQNSQIWACFIEEREKMKAKKRSSVVVNCPLLNSGGVDMDAIARDEVAVYQVCSKCGGDVPGESMLDKNGRVVCENCVDTATSVKTAFKKMFFGNEEEGENVKKSGEKKSKGSGFKSLFSSKKGLGEKQSTSNGDGRPAAVDGGSGGISNTTGGGVHRAWRSPSAPVTSLSPSPSSHGSSLLREGGRGGVVRSFSQVPSVSSSSSSSSASVNSRMTFWEQKGTQGSASSTSTPSRAPRGRGAGGTSVTERTRVFSPSSSSSTTSSSTTSSSSTWQKAQGVNIGTRVGGTRERRIGTLLRTEHRHEAPGKPLPPPPLSSGPHGNRPMEREAISSSSSSTCTPVVFCGACGNPLVDKEHALHSLNALWHPHCAPRCPSCNDLLPSNPNDTIEQGGRLHHKTCLHPPSSSSSSSSSSPTYCVQCGKELVGKCIDVGGLHMHAQCFKCACCSKVITDTVIDRKQEAFCSEQCANEYPPFN